MKYKFVYFTKRIWKTGLMEYILRPEDLSLANPDFEEGEIPKELLDLHDKIPFLWDIDPLDSYYNEYLPDRFYYYKDDEQNDIDREGYMCCCGKDPKDTDTHEYISIKYKDPPVKCYIVKTKHDDREYVDIDLWCVKCCPFTPETTKENVRVDKAVKLLYRDDGDCYLGCVIDKNSEDYQKLVIVNSDNHEREGMHFFDISVLEEIEHPKNKGLCYRCSECQECEEEDERHLSYLTDFLMRKNKRVYYG